MTNFLSLRNPRSQAKFLGVLATKESVNINYMKDPFQDGFARRLQAAMRAAGLSTSRMLAQLMGQPETRVRNWTNGTSTPPARDAISLAQALGVTLDWLYRERVEGLTESKRIRIVAAMQGIEPPATLSDEEIDAEGESEAEAPPARQAAPGRASRRQGTKATSD